MIPKLREVAAALEGSRRELLEVVGALSQEELDRTPAPGVWSVGENLHHLVKAETGVARLFAKRVPQEIEAGLQRDPEPGTSVLDCLAGRGLEDRTRRLTSPEFVLPSPSVPKTELLAALAGARASLLESLERFSGYDLSRIVHSHPRLGDIDLYQWLMFVVQHERRHTMQIREALATAVD